jgi:hypothetical protein
LNASARAAPVTAATLLLALSLPAFPPASAQEGVAVRLCELYWGVPEVRSKLRADCACVGRYLASIKADPIDIEVHLRIFASVYTGNVQAEADALRAKFGAERYQAALERSREFLSGMITRGGCKLEPA